MAFEMKAGDTAPAYETTLYDNYGSGTETPIDLTNATEVKMRMRTRGAEGAPKLEVAVAITEAKAGKVRYVWKAATDTEPAGTYDVEFVIHWNDGTIETVPNEGFGTIVFNAIL